jgi:asparagine synthase (glutamine-hydrolysing)
MMDLIAHRGPDGEGRYVSGPVGLGHRRLSIIDLSPAGKQPMSNDDKTVFVIYNGEIYNFYELRGQLVSKGYVFRSKTDTEVLVHGYEEWGMDGLVSRIQGMFAFAIWDARTQRLFIARDRVGIKPLYYTSTEKAFLFASEIKSLLVDPSVVCRMSARAIDRFLTYYYLPGNETLFEDIHKLDPGHYLTVIDGHITKRRYWDFRFEVSSRWNRFDEAVEAVQELLQRSVKNHMISDVPVGVLLSGGVDSTGVLRYAVEQTGRQIQTFTVGFEGEQFSDERPYASLAARRYGSLHQDITMSAKEFLGLLPKYIWHMEEPVCEPPAIALYLVSCLARESSVKVLLSGEGGDEAFGGYQTYRNLLVLEALKSAFGPAKGLLRFALQALSRVGWKRFGRYAALVDSSVSQYYFSRTSTPDTPFNRLKPILYTKEFVSTLEEEKPEVVTHHLFDHVNSQMLLNSLLYVDSKTWLPDDLLIKADKMTMAASVELRVPLLDIQILEFAASLPPHFKVRGLATKRILKAALEDSVPHDILHRKKTGFPVPYDRWLRNELKDFVSETVLNTKSALNGYFTKEGLAQLLQNNQRGLGCSQEIFCLLILELLSQQFLSCPVRLHGVH